MKQNTHIFKTKLSSLYSKTLSSPLSILTAMAPLILCLIFLWPIVLLFAATENFVSSDDMVEAIDYEFYDSVARLLFEVAAIILQIISHHWKIAKKQENPYKRKQKKDKRKQQLVNLCSSSGWLCRIIDHWYHCRINW